MLSPSADTHAAVQHLKSQLEQLRADLEGDMPHEQTIATRAQIDLLKRLIHTFTPA